MINNKEQPLVTVAMVTYNSAKYVDVAIQSVLASSYTNFELIISDDASTDNTWELIKSYKDERIRAYRNPVNIKEYPNRNKCIDLAKGKYFIFIDGDDYIYPHGLEFIVKMLEKNPNCAMALMHNQRKNVIYPAVVTPHMYYIGEYFFSGFSGVSFAETVFKTNILKETGGVPNNYGAGDNYTRNKIAISHKTLIIPNGHTWWRNTPGQASQKIFASRNYFKQSYQMKLYFLRDRNNPLNEKETKDALRNIYRIITREIIKNFLKFKINIAYDIYRHFEISIIFFKYAFSSFIKKDPFEKYTPDKPYHNK